MTKRRSSKVPKVAFDLSLVEREQKTKMYSFRLSEHDLAELRRAADALGVSVTDYLLSLHRQAYGQLKQKGRV